MEIIWCQHRPRVRLFFSFCVCWHNIVFSSSTKEIIQCVYSAVLHDEGCMLPLDCTVDESVITSLWSVAAGGWNVSLSPFLSIIVTLQTARVKVHTCAWFLSLKIVSTSSACRLQNYRVFVFLHVCLLAHRPYAYLMSVSQSPWSVNGPSRALSQWELSSLRAPETSWPAVHAVCEMSQHCTLQSDTFQKGHTEK